MLQSSQRYCGGDSLGDRWARRVSQTYAATVAASPCRRGVSLVPGGSAGSAPSCSAKRWRHADGRHAGKPSATAPTPTPASAGTGGDRRRPHRGHQTGYGKTCPLAAGVRPTASPRRRAASSAWRRF
jgi:formate C-acetyltransferase